MKQFLKEVEMLLDHKNRHSFAFLEGEERNKQKHPWINEATVAAQKVARKNWQDVIEEINREYSPFFMGMLPSEGDPTVRKAILIRRSL
jgi:hypothetical protein